MPNIFSIACLGALLFVIACGPGENQAAKTKPNAKQSLTPDGMAIFRQNCVTCHGADGTLGLNGAKDLRQSTLTLEERITIVTEGKKLMTPFKTVLSPEEIQAVAAYTQTFKQ